MTPCTCALALVMLLCGCASLSKGWVKVDFMEPPAREMVCQFSLDADRDLSAKCVSLKTLLKEVNRVKKHPQVGDL